jgi:hypothetical protein
MSPSAAVPAPRVTELVLFHAIGAVHLVHLGVGPQAPREGVQRSGGMARWCGRGQGAGNVTGGACARGLAF